MKVKKLNLDNERKILIYLITSDDFCKRIIPIFHPAHLKSEYSRIVGEWIVEYYSKYKEAPKQIIQEIYREKREYIKDEEDSDLVADFLQKLSTDYANTSPNNLEFSAEKAEKYLKLRSVEVLIEDLQNSVIKNDPLTAEQMIANYSRVEMPTGEGTDLLEDSQNIIDAFNDEEEVLFKFPGVLGDIAGTFSRGEFVSFMAPMKRGKCLAGGSLILLADGSLKKIKDLYDSNYIPSAVSINERMKI